jgi:hypothetical protein
MGIFTESGVGQLKQIEGSASIQISMGARIELVALSGCFIRFEKWNSNRQSLKR